MAVWKDIPTWEGLYIISDLGEICSLDRQTARGLKRGRQIKQHVSNGGYYRARLQGNGNDQTALVHSLVCRAFHGPRHDGMVAAHINGNSLDNRASNLKWCTQKENIHDRKAHGTWPSGENNPASKLNKNDVGEIYKLRSQKMKVADIASKFGVSVSAIECVIYKKTWREV